MSADVGIGFAFVAMLAWGIGDFYIQKSARAIGDWGALFAVTFFGVVVLLPFVYDDIPDLFSGNLREFYILTALALVLL
jgi:hypothetical protein